MGLEINAMAQGSNTVMFSVVMDRFVEQSPTSVMFRGTLENAVIGREADRLVVITKKRAQCRLLAGAKQRDAGGLTPRAIKPLRDAVDLAMCPRSERRTPCSPAQKNFVNPGTASGRGSMVAFQSTVSGARRSWEFIAWSQPISWPV